ncbi:hypothetical protein ACV2HJ_23800, partial [Salmonella enterica subsp. enterica serovar Miami]
SDESAVLVLHNNKPLQSFAAALPRLRLFNIFRMLSFRRLTRLQPQTLTNQFVCDRVPVTGIL